MRRRTRRCSRRNRVASRPSRSERGRSVVSSVAMTAFFSPAPSSCGNRPGTDDAARAALAQWRAKRCDARSHHPSRTLFAEYTRRHSPDPSDTLLGVAIRLLGDHGRLPQAPLHARKVVTDPICGPVRAVRVRRLCNRGARGATSSTSTSELAGSRRRARGYLSCSPMARASIASSNLANGCGVAESNGDHCQGLHANHRDTAMGRRVR